MAGETAILVPVLDRPHRIRPLVENIEAVTPEPHWILFAASDQPTLEEIRAVGSELAGCRVLLSIDEGDTWPNRINRLYGQARELHCSHVFTGADDLLFHERWLSEALATMSTLPDSSGVVVVEDLYNPAGTMALITVDYIERFGGTADNLPGYVMYPGYLHNWSDTECFAVAQARGRHARAFTSVVEHLHHGAGLSPFDSTYEKGMESELQDRALFRSRHRLIESLRLAERAPRLAGS